MKNLTKYYISFLIIYTVIALFRSYFITYLPFYFYDVIQIENSLLALIQMMVLVTPVILPPLLGYLYDNMSAPRVYPVILFSCLVLPLSFIIVLLNMENIISFFLFFTIAYGAIWFIRGGMIKNYLTAVSNEKGAMQAKIMSNTVYITHTSSLLGTLLTIIFYFFIDDITSVLSWRLFLFLGFVASIPIISIIFLKHSIVPKIELEEEVINGKEGTRGLKIILLPLLSTFILMFFNETDELFNYSLPSWIGVNFGLTTLDIFFKTIIISYIFALLGNYLMKRLYELHCKKSRKEDTNEREVKRKQEIFMRRCLFFGFIIYNSFLMYSFYADELIFLIIWWFFLPFIGAIIRIFMSILISSIAIRSQKHKTLAYILQISVANIGMLIFTPLGIFLYPVIGMISLVALSLSVSSFFLFINLWHLNFSRKKSF